MMGAYGYMRLRVRNLRRSAMLQRERMMAEYEQLKNQVNPHFLFNSLNTLASLIEENGEAAVQYTIQLSDLYRSMLSYKDRDLIYLSEEWTLLQKYVFIQQSRFGDGFQLHVDLPEAISKTRQIVPLALQMLVENAIKHNIVSTARPLDIYISATNDTLTVRNTLNPKMSKEKGAGLGLQNISRRYALMSSRSMAYGIQDNQFIVTLPLL
jgi:LytS/YehU family sensor histidine kinase